MNCSLCGHHSPDNIANHVRLMHPNILALDGNTYRTRMTLLKPVTQKMNDADHVCEKCDRQFILGMTFGEIFEGMFGDMPIMSVVCGECFMMENE